MRDPADRPLPSVSVVLMVVLGVAFVLQCINDVYLHLKIDGSEIQSWLALTPSTLKSGRLWQLISFQFLHVSLLHLISNLLGLWFLGRHVENVLGPRRYLLAYFGCGIVGGLLQGALMQFFPLHFGGFVLGASAGVSGIFAIFCRIEAGSEVKVNFIFPIRTDVLLWITTGIALFFTVVPSKFGGGVAHAAHLGGILAGLAFVKLGWHHDFNPLPGAELLERFRNRPRRSKPIIKVRFPKALPTPAAKAARAAKSAKPAPPGDTDFMSKEVDPILEKISAHGIHSLTEREREILAAAKARMQKR